MVLKSMPGAITGAVGDEHVAVVQLLNHRLDVLARGSDIAPGSALAGGIAGAALFSFIR